MGELTFQWLLDQAVRQKVQVPVLEVGLCQGSLLLERFSCKSRVTRKSTKFLKKTKSLLSFFLNKTVPSFCDYNPAQPVCYIYFDGGVKLLTVKDVEEVAASQLYISRVRSVHRVIPVVHSVDTLYTAKAWVEENELFCELRAGSLRVESKHELVTEEQLVEPVLRLLKTIVQLFVKAEQGFQFFHFDLVFDESRSPFIVAVKKIVTEQTTVIRAIRSAQVKKWRISLILSEDSFSISGSDADCAEFSPLSKGEYPASKQLLACPVSPSFVTMISRTIDKCRRKEENERNCQNNVERISQNQRDFKTISLKQFNHNFSTIEGLIHYLEKSRPRVWARDLKKTRAEESSIITPTSFKTRKTSVCTSAHALPVSCILPPLKAALHRSERCVRRLTEKYSKCKIPSLA